MILRVHHVGVAARSLEESLRFWKDALGMAVSRTETVESEGVRVTALQTVPPTLDDVYFGLARSAA